MAREGARHTAQALQQRGPARRLTTLVATLRELEATLSDAAISMFSALVGRANLNARKRLEETIAVANDQGRSEEHTSELQSLMRISYAVFCLKKNTNLILEHMRKPDKKVRQPVEMPTH